MVAAENFGDKDTDTTTQLTKIRKAARCHCLLGHQSRPGGSGQKLGQPALKCPFTRAMASRPPNSSNWPDAAEGIFLPTGKIIVTGLLNDDDAQKEVLTNFSEQC